MRTAPQTDPAPSRRKPRTRLLLVVFTLLFLSLGCISVQAAFQITPTDRGLADVRFTYTQELSDSYIEAAKRANADLLQDYAQAGKPAPDALFPTSWTELSPLAGNTLPDPSMVVTHEDEKGFTAETNYAVSAGSDTPDFWNLTIGDVDENGAQLVIFEISTPNLSKEFDYAEFARNREAPMPPKPPVVQDGAGDGGGGVSGLMGAVQRIMELVTKGTLSELGIEGWYLQRIIKEADLPVYTYKITMPGEITAHTIDGQTVGSVDSSGSVLTFTVDDAYLRSLGSQAKWIHIESQVNQCDAECSAQPNMMWDTSVPGPGCTCICKKGYESDDRGDCVSCDTVCAAYDPLAVADPENSGPNACGCTCAGNLMEFSWGESDGECRCIAGAERKGDDCVCRSGYELNIDGTQCIHESETADEPKENCPSGTNCFENPNECTCGRGTLCDPMGEFKDNETFCSVPIAYILIADDVTLWEYLWITDKITAIRTFFQDRGYTTVTRWQGVGLKMETYLGRPSTEAVAYFGHGLEPSVEGMTAAQLSGAVFQATRDQYEALGFSAQEAYQMSEAKRNNLGIKYFYNHSCHSLDDKTIRDYTVGSGGTYWGSIGILWPWNDLTETRKP